MARNARGRAFRRVLVGYDGSLAAQEALRVATELGSELDADVRVLVVVKPLSHAETTWEREEAMRAEQERLSDGLADLAASGSGGALDVRAVHAEDAGQALAAHAREHAFDLVVVGAHGSDQPSHRGIGHSLDGLIRRAPCPVLVVRADS